MTGTRETGPALAVLVDADNASSSIIEGLLAATGHFKVERRDNGVFIHADR